MPPANRDQDGLVTSLIPSPDPTKLTTEATDKLDKTIRELVRSEMDHLDRLFQEKFTTVEQKFKALTERTEEQKRDTKDALVAALAAQKEAVASQTAASEKSITKSETTTTERIKGVETLLATTTKATDDKIGDLKERITTVESRRFGQENEQTKNTTSNQWIVGLVIGSVIGVIGLVVGVVGMVVAFKH